MSQPDETRAGGAAATEAAPVFRLHEVTKRFGGVVAVEGVAFDLRPGEEDLQLGIDITKNYLRANPDTAGVFGITSVALPGAAEAVEQAGLQGEVAVTGLSTPNEMKPYIESGAVEEFVLWNPVDLGYLAVHVANAQIEGNMPKSGTFEAGRLGKVKLLAEDEVLLGPPLVFSEKNIDEYDF